jgi:DNA repair protein RecO (recombination protein O)
MDWRDSTILLSTRPHGESSAVATVFGQSQGRHAGMVHGGQGRQKKGLLLPGNILLADWRGRTSDQLGTFSFELLRPVGAGWLQDGQVLALLTSAMALLDISLPDRNPYPALYDRTVQLLLTEDPADWPHQMILWEMDLLADLGFGLNLSCCAVTGAAEDLAYVSPRTGCAVTAAAGHGYRDRLLRLPPFLITGEVPGDADLLLGLKLTGYFLERHLLAPLSRPLPAARQRVLEIFERRVRSFQTVC